MRTGGVALFPLALAFAGLAGVAFQGDTAPTPVRRATPESGKNVARRIYDFRCATCHGYAGDARTLASLFLSPPPRDFTSSKDLSRARMIAAVRDGRPGTAMQGFGSVMAIEEIDAVVDFVRTSFMEGSSPPGRYHTAENGWPDHERYAEAFPFVTGALALDRALDTLSPGEIAGRRLYVGACISCHEAGRASDARTIWERRAVSFPPNVDACEGCHVYSRLMHGRTAETASRRKATGTRSTSASPYARHDVPPAIRLTATAQRGERLFRRNCAFCHALDGSGRNWTGTFLEPHPRDLGDRRFISTVTRRALATAIHDGVPGTSMPAWKSVLREDEVEALLAYLSEAFGPVAP